MSAGSKIDDLNNLIKNEINEEVNNIDNSPDRTPKEIEEIINNPITSTIKERLKFNLEYVEGLRSNLDMFKESAETYNLIADFINNYDKLVN